MQRLTHSGDTNSLGVRLSPIRRRDVSRSSKSAASVTGRQAERRRRKMSAVAKSFNPNNRQPASQNDDRIRMMKPASNSPLMDGVNSIAVPEDMDGVPGAHSPAPSEDSGEVSATCGDSTFVSYASVVESRLCETAVNAASASR